MFVSVEFEPGCQSINTIATHGGALWTGGPNLCTLSDGRLVRVPLDDLTQTTFPIVDVWSHDAYGPMATVWNSTPPYTCRLSASGCRREERGLLGRGYAYLNGERFGIMSDTIKGSRGLDLLLPSPPANYAIHALDGGLLLGTDDGLLFADPKSEALRVIWDGAAVKRIISDDQGAHLDRPHERRHAAGACQRSRSKRPRRCPPCAPTACS